MDVLENSDFFGESRISWTFWTRKLGFCSLQAQRVDDQTGYTRRPKSASDSIFRCPGTPDFRPVFGHFGHFSAPAAPLELKTGLSISISAPLSVSEHQMAQKWPKNGQTGGSKKWKKQKNENWKKTKIEKQTRKRKAKRKKQIKKTREKDKKKQDEVFDVSLPRWSFFLTLPRGSLPSSSQRGASGATEAFVGRGPRWLPGGPRSGPRCSFSRREGHPPAGPRTEIIGKYRKSGKFINFLKFLNYFETLFFKLFLIFPDYFLNYFELFWFLIFWNYLIF